MNTSLNYSRIEKAIKYFKDNYQEQPSLEDAAAYVRLSKFHFQRMFEAWAGVSPKTFVQFLTIEHAKKLLKKGHSTLSASYDAGLSGTGRLHDLFIKIESVTPGQYKTAGKGVKIIYGFYDTLFGQAMIAETDKGLCHLSFAGSKVKALQDLRSRWQNADLTEKKGKHAVTVVNFINKKIVPSQKIPLDIRGTEFQVKVWEALLKIPSGHLVSYGHLARRIGHPKASRAVGSAVGKNPIAYIIPCHRVIREAGEIGEYHWGSRRKTAMIGWESANN